MSESVQLATRPWTSNDATFGARLALVRQHKGWGNVKEAALICGVPAQSWRTWERDGVMPHSGRYFDICARIARASGCDYGWLVDRRPTGTVEPTVPYVRLNLQTIAGEGDSSAPARPSLRLIKN